MRRPTGRALGFGPWRVLADCPASAHNTISAARASHGEVKCICPRGQALMEAYLERKAANMRTARRSGYISARDPGPLPDLNDGACARPGNADLFTDAQSEDRTNITAAHRRKAAGICLTECPAQILAACRKYILAGEIPAGSWGGVWGGMTPVERQKARKIRVH